MKHDIEIKELAEQPTLTIRETANLASIPDRMGKIFTEIMAFMEKNRDCSCRRTFCLLA